MERREGDTKKSRVNKPDWRRSTKRKEDEQKQGQCRLVIVEHKRKSIDGVKNAGSRRHGAVGRLDKRNNRGEA